MRHPQQLNKAGCSLNTEVCGFGVRSLMTFRSPLAIISLYSMVRLPDYQRDRIIKQLRKCHQWRRPNFAAISGEFSIEDIAFCQVINLAEEDSTRKVILTSPG